MLSYIKDNKGNNMKIENEIIDSFRSGLKVAKIAKKLKVKESEVMDVIKSMLNEAMKWCEMKRYDDELFDEKVNSFNEFVESSRGVESSGVIINGVKF